MQIFKPERAPGAGENGGREDVRWVALAGADGGGVAAVALNGQAMHINVSRRAPAWVQQPEPSRNWGQGG